MFDIYPNTLDLPKVIKMSELANQTVRCALKSMFVMSLFLTLFATNANAVSLAVWNFNDAGVSGTNSPSNTTSLFSVDRGNGFMSSTFAPANITDFAGTVNNADGSDPAGVALALEGGTTLLNNGASLTFSSNTTGFSKINVSFAIQRTPTGFTTDQFQYSANGTIFVNFSAPFVPSANFASVGGIQSFDLSAITGLNNNSLTAFRIIFNGATTSSGNNRIDNLVISGEASVPEPGASSLGIAASLAGVGLIFCRRRFRQRA